MLSVDSQVRWVSRSVALGKYPIRSILQYLISTQLLLARPPLNFHLWLYFFSQSYQPSLHPKPPSNCSSFPLKPFEFVRTVVFLFKLPCRTRRCSHILSSSRHPSPSLYSVRVFLFVSVYLVTPAAPVCTLLALLH